MQAFTLTGARMVALSRAARSTFQTGLSLVEVMIIVLIMGLVLAGLLPSYEESAIRAKIAEGLGLTAPHKASVAQNALAGRALNANPPSVPGKSALSTISVAADGVITLTYNPAEFGANPAGKIVGGPTVTLVPSLNGLPLNKALGKTSSNGIGLSSSAVVEWSCATESSTLTVGPRGSLPSKLAPPECR
jgi:type IV pilus assembly protein PilA